MSEPAVGWTLGLGTGLSQVKAAGLGHIQEWVGDRTNLLDFVPVDYVCKTILAATVTADRSRKSPLVYQVGTSHNKGMQLQMFGKHIESYWRSAPIPRKRISNDIRCEYYPLKEFNDKFDQRFRTKIEQARMNNDQKAIKGLQQLREKSSMFEYFHGSAFIFDMTNAIRLDETAPKELRSGLKFEMDWKDYVYRVCFGVHKYILGEPVEFNQPTQFTPRL
ncbi:cyclin-dependent kinase inhibitor far1 [Entomortierella beljakovae]|nr:cyclin-dependent kinase inhibitor far1 [Entomortierella beljakovae]